MPKANVFNMAGEKIGEIELSEAIFGIEPNKSVLHDAVKNHLANCRQGTQSALTRGEVSGGGKKPWRQKGTGHARQGSTRAPQWTHGGIVFAPKPRSYSYVLNKKVKRLAMKSALSSKVAAEEMLVVENLAVEEIKTRTVADMLAAKVKHALMLERNMMALLPKVKGGDPEARKQYEWYMQMAKSTSLKDLQGFVKLFAPTAAGEESDGFDGFDDG